MLDYAVFTDKGSREINEDSLQCCEADGRYLFVLCDGLGGHGRGEAASALVVQTFCEVFREVTEPDSFFPAAFGKAQERLLAEQQRLHAPNEMKTTAVALVISGERFAYAHIGDSRLYRFRRSKPDLRTLDHSVPQMLALAGDIREKQIRTHPDRNRLLRVMGVKGEAPRYAVGESGELRGGDAFLLCSDGFWEPVHEKEMSRFLKKTETAQDWLDAMAQTARQNSKGKDMDNFSAVGVRIPKRP